MKLSSRWYSLLALLVLCLGVVAAPVYAAQKPKVSWVPRTYATKISAGDKQDVAVKVGVRESIDDITVSVSPGLKKYIKVSPEKIKRINPKTPVDITIHIAIPANTEPGDVSGYIQLKEFDVKKGEPREKKAYDQKLPIAIVVAKKSIGASDVSLSLNAASPLLLRYHLDQLNTTATWFGFKNPDATINSLASLSLKAPDQSPTRLDFDDGRRPSKVFLSDGSSLNFNWQTETQALVSAISSDGKAQANLSVDFANIPAVGTGAQTQVDATVLDAAGLKLLNTLDQSPKPRSAKSAPALTSKAQSLISQSQALAVDPLTDRTRLTIAVSSGVSTPAPVAGAQVSAIITPRSGVVTGDNAYSISAYERGNGNYVAQFANQPNLPQQAILATCPTINEALGLTCKELKFLNPPSIAYVCGTLSTLMTATGVGAPAAVAFLPACIAGLTGAQVTCNVYVAAGVPSDFCERVENFLDEYNPDGVIVDATASKGPLQGESTIEVPGNASTATMAIKIPESPCEVIDFTSNPVDPAPQQGYVATVSTSCTGEADVIQMSMSGTDGFTTSTSCTGTTQCSLAVPGAEDGVVDTVTVTTSTGNLRSIILQF